MRSEQVLESSRRIHVILDRADALLERVRLCCSGSECRAQQRFSPRRSSASAYDYDEGLEMESWDCRLLARDYPSTKLNEQSLCQPQSRFGRAEHSLLVSSAF